MAKSSGNRTEPATIDGGTGALVPTERLQRTPLKTMEHVKRELGRVYRSVKEGHLSSDEGSRRAYILNTLGKVIESADIERRIEVVETQLRTTGGLLPGSFTRDDEG